MRKNLCQDRIVQNGWMGRKEGEDREGEKRLMREGRKEKSADVANNVGPGWLQSGIWMIFP